MAVLPYLPGIEAVILINGKQAHEYDDEDEVQVEHEDEGIAAYQSTHTISKHIQSETDQKFTIQLTVGPPYVKGTFMPHVRLNYHISVDGAKVADPWCSRLDFKHSQVGYKWTKEVLGVTQKSGQKVKPFIFAGIATNNDTVATAGRPFGASKGKGRGGCCPESFQKSSHRRAANKKRIVHAGVIDLTGDDEEEEEDEDTGEVVGPGVMEQEEVVEDEEARGAAVGAEVVGEDMFI